MADCHLVAAASVLYLETVGVLLYVPDWQCGARPAAVGLVVRLAGVVLQAASCSKPSTLLDLLLCRKSFAK